MLNGKMLKVVFVGIIACMMIVLLSSTVLVLLSKMAVDVYKDLLGFLGIPTVIGIITQKVLNMDENHDGIPDYQQPEPTDKEKKDEKSIF